MYRRCGGGGDGLIASARSGSRRLCQTQWYRRNGDRNYSKLNRLDLIHIIFPPSEAFLFECPILHCVEHSARADLLRLCRRRIFHCYTWGDRHSPVRDRMEQVPGDPRPADECCPIYIYRYEEGSPMRCRSACPSPWQPWRQRLSVKGLNRRYCPIL